MLKIHKINVQGKSGGFKCEICQHYTSDRSNLKIHVKNIHSDRPKKPSKGESSVERSIVNNLNFERYCYELEKSFSNLRLYCKNRLLRHDFAISPVGGKKEYFLIEYDGIQHYEPVK